MLFVFVRCLLVDANLGDARQCAEGVLANSEDWDLLLQRESQARRHRALWRVVSTWRSWYVHPLAWLAVLIFRNGAASVKDGDRFV